MAQTIGEAIRNLVMTSGVIPFNRFYLDSAPDKAFPPYITYNDAESAGPVVRGDGSISWYDRTVSLDLWMTAHEDMDTVLDLRNLLNGVRLDIDEGVAMPVTIETMARIPEPKDSNLSHWTYTLTLVHDGAVI